MQEGRRRQKEIGYIWRREQVAEIVQDKDNITLDKTSLLQKADGQYLSFKQSLHIKLDTTDSKEGNNEPLDSEFNQRPEITELHSLSGSPRVQSSKGCNLPFLYIIVAIRELFS